jgi:hypothetical protein
MRLLLRAFNEHRPQRKNSIDLACALSEHGRRPRQPCLILGFRSHLDIQQLDLPMEVASLDLQIFRCA